MSALWAKIWQPVWADLWYAPFVWGSEPTPYRTYFGEGLPVGWSFVPNAVNGVSGDLTFSGGFAVVSQSSGSSIDCIFSAGGITQVARLMRDLTGDFDIAVQHGSIIGGESSSMLGFYFEGATSSDAVRWSLFGDTTRTSKYGYFRSGGTGDTFQSLSSTLFHFYGAPSWLRARRAGNVFTFYTSGDGVNWIEQSSGTRVVDVQTISLTLGQYSQVLGIPARWNVFVDLAAAGTTDARLPADQLNWQYETPTATDFSSGLPAWLSISAQGDGSAEVVGETVVLRTADADNSTGRLYYSGTAEFESAGALFDISASTNHVRAWVVLGLAFDDGGGVLDTFMLSPTLGLEIRWDTSQHSLLIRAHRPLAINAVDEPYTFLRDQVPTTNNRKWWRVEWHAPTRRFRAKWWDNGDSEPSAWWFDGEDAVLVGNGPAQPYVSISHLPSQNVDGTTPGIVVHRVEYYEIN
jgi:hypothetical protein